MENNLYYEAPSDAIFEEVKATAMQLWETYDDSYGYATGKKPRIEIENVEDNLMYIVAMFDDTNQLKLSAKLSPEANEAIHARIIAGGGNYSPFQHANNN
jgi:hypothetical protein